MRRFSNILLTVDIEVEHAAARELGVELSVMRTVARTGIAGYFTANTAETILNQVDCPVLTVKPAGLVSPVALAPR